MYVRDVGVSVCGGCDCACFKCSTLGMFPIFKLPSLVLVRFIYCLQRNCSFWSHKLMLFSLSGLKSFHLSVLLSEKSIVMYNAFNVYRRELAPGTVKLTGDRAQGDDSKHWAYSIHVCLFTSFQPCFYDA